MYFKCDISKITAPQLAACTAIATLYHEQSMPCVVTSLDPITFELKPHLSAQMRERLIANRVPTAAHGYTGQIVENTLVVQSEEAAKPTRRRKPRASTGDSDIQQSEAS